MIKVICDMCGREIPRYDRIKLKPEYDQMLVPMDYSESKNAGDKSRAKERQNRNISKLVGQHKHIYRRDRYVDK